MSIKENRREYLDLNCTDVGWLPRISVHLFELISYYKVYTERKVWTKLHPHYSCLIYYRCSYCRVWALACLYRVCEVWTLFAGVDLSLISLYINISKAWMYVKAFYLIGRHTGIELSKNHDPISTLSCQKLYIFLSVTPQASEVSGGLARFRSFLRDWVEKGTFSWCWVSQLTLGGQQGE